MIQLILVLTTECFMLSLMVYYAFSTVFGYSSKRCNIIFTRNAIECFSITFYSKRVDLCLHFPVIQATKNTSKCLRILLNEQLASVTENDQQSVIHLVSRKMFNPRFQELFSSAMYPWHVTAWGGAQ